MSVRISDAEWEVLHILWARSEASAADIVAALETTTSWRPTTVKTLIARLVKKRVIGFLPAAQGYIYFPLMSAQECAAEERRSLLRKVYRGDRRSMVTAFLTEERLSEDDLATLRRILEEQEPG